MTDKERAALAVAEFLIEEKLAHLRQHTDDIEPMAAQAVHVDDLTGTIEVLLRLRKHNYTHAGERLVQMLMPHDHEFEDRCHCGLLAAEYHQNEADHG